MRYRIGEDPSLATGAAGTEGALVFTLVISIIFGAILMWLGIRGRQFWLWTWSAGLIVVSLGTWIWMALE